MMSEFSGPFASFDSLFSTVHFNEYNVYTWANNPKATAPTVFRLVGYTHLSDSRYMLHVIPLFGDAVEQKTEDLLKDHQICFIMLEQLIGEYGCVVDPVLVDEDN